MASIADYTAAIRARGISATEISDDNLSALMGEVLHEFSRYKPQILDRTFDTVADQQKYTWTEMGDSTGRTVLECLWNPYATGDEWELAQMAATIGVPWEAGDWHQPSQSEIDQLKAGAYARNYGGKGYQIERDGGSLYLDPLPGSSGIKVYIVYTKPYAAVTDIASADRDAWLDLLHSRTAERLAMEIAKPSNVMHIKTPEYEKRLGEQVGAWRKIGKEKFEEFISKVNAGHATAGRS